MKRFVAIVLLGVLLVSAAAYGENKTYVLRTSTNTAQNSTIGEALAYFATQVNAKSKKRINVTVNYGSELGSQSEQVEMATTGSLDMVVAAPGTGLGVWVPQLVMFEFPYLFKDNAQYRRVLKGMTPEVSRLVASYGFTAASGQSQGARDMLTIKPVKSLQDMKGLKMRGPNSIYLTMFNDLGAAGTTTDWNDIYTALQTKVIDGMESSPSAINSMKFNEVAPNLTVTNHIIACTYYFFSTKWLNSLPKDLRKVVLDCANDAAVYQAKIDDKDEAKSLSEMQAQGLKVWKLHDTDKWVKACSGMLAQYRAKGSAWNDFINKLLAIK